MRFRLASDTSSDGPLFVRASASRSRRRVSEPVRALTLLFAACVTLAVVSVRSVDAEVFHSRKEGVALAFPEADRVTDRTVVLSERQVEQIEALAKSPVPSKLVRLYTGRLGDEILGYALVDVHEVRSQQEALLLVVSPVGTLRSLRVLAFHEPIDYLPVQRWFDQFAGKSLDDGLRPGRDIHGVSGATLSTRAVANAARRALAFYAVVIRDGAFEANGVSRGEAAH